MAFVIDASATIAWALREDDPRAERARVLIETEPALVPALWWFELRNALIVNERRGRIRELARRLERDVKSVHGDVSALLKAGVLDRTDDGRVVFPYDEIHVDFVLRAA